MPDRFANLTSSEIARVVLTENRDGPRYLVIPTSGHDCCFDYSVLDRATLDDDGDPLLLCECPDEATANQIAAALNDASDSGDFDRDPSHLPKETC